MELMGLGHLPNYRAWRNPIMAAVHLLCQVVYVHPFYVHVFSLPKRDDLFPPIANL